MKFNVTIKGISPLLQHRFAEEKLTMPKKRSGDKLFTADEKVEIAKQYLYVDHKGKVSQPSSHIEGAMIKAATELKMAA